MDSPIESARIRAVIDACSLVCYTEALIMNTPPMRHEPRQATSWFLCAFFNALMKVANLIENAFCGYVSPGHLPQN